MNSLKLNRAQNLAVKHKTGPALVVAGAGTGKTAVITERIAKLIENGDAKASEILALTFTDKAANQMQDRLDDLLAYGYSDCQISTFHALGDSILREYGVEISIASDYKLLNDFSAAIAMQDVLDELKLSYYKPTHNPNHFTQGLLKFVSKLKDDLITAKDFSRFANHKKLDKDEKQRIMELASIYSAYELYLAKQNLLDFGDLILLSYQLLKRRKSLLKILQDKYRFILVDEFQDTNKAQNELLKLLSKSHSNIMVVGDDDQSIYRFRGAAVENILQFQAQFPDCKQYVLSQNYRSFQPILDSAYKLINYNNPYRLEFENNIDKRLKGKNGGVRPNFIWFESRAEEMNELGLQVKKLSEKYELKNIAILLRKNNQASSVTAVLSKLGIDYVLNESQKLFEQAEIRNIINFVNVLVDKSDSKSLFALLISRVFACDSGDMSALATTAVKRHESLLELVIEQSKTDSKLKFALDVIKKCESEINELGVSELIYKFLKDSSYLDKLVAESESDYEAAIAVQNITTLFDLVIDFEQVSKQKTAFAFWEHLRRLENSETDLANAVSPLDTNAVAIMTIHKAKGLEFDAVCVIDAVEQTFPAKAIAEKIRLPEGLFKEVEEPHNWHIMEERRLFYVAMTRAKHELYVSGSADHGGKRAKKISRFCVEASDGKYLTRDSTRGAKKSETKLIKFSPTIKLNANPMSKFYVDGWLHLSANQIADYLRSPLEFWYFQVLSLPKGPYHSLIYGSAVHSAIEYYYKAKLNNQPVRLKDLVTTFENYWDSEGFVSKNHEAERLNAGKQLIAKFFKNQEEEKHLPVAVEKPFVWHIDKLKLKIHGRYDAVYERAGKIDIRDFKTGNVDNENKAKSKLKENIQLQIYALAWEKINEQEVCSISLHFLEHDILIQSDKIEREKTMLALKKVKEGIEQEQFSEKGKSLSNFNKML